MLPMGRKYRNSNKEKHQPASNIRILKKRFARTSCINIADCHFEIKEEVIETLKSYVQHEGNEMCGVLTGTQVGKNCYRICKISPPCVKAHTHCGCERDATIANKFIEADYERSEHTRFYIGEWHTHPEDKPKPSAVDYNSIKNNYHTALLVVPLLLMIIVGTQTFHICVYNGKKFVEVVPKIV